MRLTPETLHLSICIIDTYAALANKLSDDRLQSRESYGRLSLPVLTKADHCTTIPNVQYSCMAAVTSLILAIKWQYGGARGGKQDIDEVLTGFNIKTKRGSLKIHKASVVQEERRILAVLDWDIGLPTLVNFLRFLIEVAGMQKDQCLFAICICDRILLEAKILQFAPSLLAATAVWMSQLGEQRIPAWSAPLAYYSKYSESELIPCRQAIVDVLYQEYQDRSRLWLPITPQQAKQLSLSTDSHKMQSMNIDKRSSLTNEFNTSSSVSLELALPIILKYPTLIYLNMLQLSATLVNI